MSTVSERRALPQASIAHLQALIGLNVDSRDGFREAIAQLDPGGPGQVAVLFTKIAAARDTQARELQELVLSNDEVPTMTGTVAAAAHRTWMDLRATLGGGDKAVLAEVERGEAHIRSKYATAIADLGACSCVETLRRQYGEVCRSHDEVCDMHGKC